MTNFFNKEASEKYDERNKGLAPIFENMHFLIQLILKDLPENSRILCVGVGTGAEILSLAKEYPQFTFVGVDPSAEMLEVCQKKLEAVGVTDRCELIQGYVQDISDEEKFDSVLSILVGHFVKKEEKLDFYKNINQRLKSEGIFIDTELSLDLASESFSLLLKNWEKVQTLMGATPESLKMLPETLKERLSIASPTEIDSLLKESGFKIPIRFSQSFLVVGWYAIKG